MKLTRHVFVVAVDNWAIGSCGVGIANLFSNPVRLPSSSLPFSNHLQSTTHLLFPSQPTACLPCISTERKFLNDMKDKITSFFSGKKKSTTAPATSVPAPTPVQQQQRPTAQVYRPPPGSVPVHFTPGRPLVQAQVRPVQGQVFSPQSAQEKGLKAPTATTTRPAVRNVAPAPKPDSVPAPKAKAPTRPVPVQTQQQQQGSLINHGSTPNVRTLIPYVNTGSQLLRAGATT